MPAGLGGGGMPQIEGEALESWQGRQLQTLGGKQRAQQRVGTRDRRQGQGLLVGGGGEGRLEGRKAANPYLSLQHGTAL